MYRIRFRLFGLLLFMTVIAIALSISVHWWPVDGIKGMFVRLLSDQDTTVYAPSYSDAAFRRIRIGMQRTKVYELLGEPVEFWNPRRPGRPGETRATWSYSPSGGDYRRREIVFHNDVVVKKFAGYELD